MSSNFNILVGDCLNILKELPDNSIDSIVTDPPYGLKFMSKKWDVSVPGVDTWKECLRVLKPGGHLLSFGGTRTYHHLAMNIELAGFEIRDQLQWLYGSGFPKSYNISKGIDKKLSDKESKELCKQWDGFGTALKPANEPIVLARKPLSEKNIVDNVLKWGTGGLNIDDCRVDVSDNDPNHRKATGKNGGADSMFGVGNSKRPATLTQGRFPANLLLDEDAAKMLDEQSGPCKTGKLEPHHKLKASKNNCMSGDNQERNPRKSFGGDSGGASRFFYIPKVSKKERNGSLHPTMKPIKLMQYLVRLITPPNGLVLDPFMGSGSTGVACIKENFNFIGMELNPEYAQIAQKRIKHEKSTMGDSE